MWACPLCCACHRSVSMMPLVVVDVVVAAGFAVAAAVSVAEPDPVADFRAADFRAGHVRPLAVLHHSAGRLPGHRLRHHVRTTQGPERFRGRALVAEVSVPERVRHCSQERDRVSEPVHCPEHVPQRCLPLDQVVVRASDRGRALVREPASRIVRDRGRELRIVPVSLNCRPGCRGWEQGRMSGLLLEHRGHACRIKALGSRTG